MKKLFAFAVIPWALLAGGTGFAQTQFEVPEDGVLVTREDYVKYESTIIDAAKWLEETDLDKETAKRLLVMDFVLRWMSGSAAVKLEVTDAIARLYDRNDPLLGVFLASYARSVLENKDSTSRFTATKAAVLSMMTVYKKGISIRKSKQMDIAIKAERENKLDDYIEEVLHVSKE